MKTVVLDGHSRFSTYYFNQTNSDGSVVTCVGGLDKYLLCFVLKQMNMTFVQVPLPKVLI